MQTWTALSDLLITAGNLSVYEIAATLGVETDDVIEHAAALGVTFGSPDLPQSEDA